MNAQTTPKRWFFVYFALLSACAAVETDKPVQVKTVGPHSVLAGQTVQLSATTLEGIDTGHSWASADEAIAIVDPQGVVTGVTPGETTIFATGVETVVRAEHAMVVITEDGAGGGSGTTPFYQAWASSAHADINAEAFTHWNDEGEVQTACAKCHSSDGYVDYLGGDGTAPGRVDAPGTVQSGVNCAACHDSAAAALTSVTFPSGETVSGLGPEARCMVCHQGRASGLDVDEQIAEAGVADPDEPHEDLGFTNVHYYPAAATLYAAQAKGGYQYEGRTYDTRFRHVPELDACTNCHDPHSTRINFERCATCHEGTTDVVTARNIRQIASRNQDYDGDGNRSEGIYFEIEGLGEVLLTAILRYGAESNDPICYGESHPYWFKDADGDGTCSEEESVRENAYTRWTPRLAKAAYNYQIAHVDPGNFAHNAKYTIQLLHDSIQDVNAGLVVPLDTGALVREDPGHFNGAGEAARYWDESEEVSASCSRCHSGSQGYRFFTEYGVGMTVPETDNGLDCATCHDSFGDTNEVRVPTQTWLPDGTTVALPGDDNLCANCHIGRVSKAQIDAAISRGGSLRFQNVHYLPAAATREGTGAKVGYEYDGKSYAGRLSHVGGVQCTSCHDAALSNHTFLISDVWDARCSNCHADFDAAEEVRLVRLSDYDGDGNTSESLKDEIAGMAGRLLSAMQAASGNTICYDRHSYPYFFKDTNGDGLCGEDEAVGSNGYGGFSPALLKAAHNYQLSQTEPGAWAHNFDYMGQLLYDSVEDLSGNAPANMIRPSSR